MNSTQELLMARYGVCPYCLSNQDVLTNVGAYTDGMMTWAPGEISVNPVALLTWIETTLGEHAGRVRFRVNDAIDCFVPVAVLSGSPVCAVHLVANTHAHAAARARRAAATRPERM